MTTPPNPAQPLNVDFTHRLVKVEGTEFSKLDFIDTVDQMVCRATAILDTLSCQFDGDGQDRLSNEVIYWTIEAAIKEIKDIVHAFVMPNWAGDQTTLVNQPGRDQAEPKNTQDV